MQASPSRASRKFAHSAIASLLALGMGLSSPAFAAEHWDFTGHVAANVSSVSGRVERVAVTVGDGGRGPYKAVLIGDPSLPTHTLYRPRDLTSFGPSRPLPVMAFANGGCRDSSGEFRNFLTDIASYGYLVIAIGPASNAATEGSEDELSITRSSQLIDAINWAARQNDLAGSPYEHKLALNEVAVAGQSCGGMQAIEASADPRVKTTLVLNSSSDIVGGPHSGRPQVAGASIASPSGPAHLARGEYGHTGGNLQGMMAGLTKMARRYDPYLPPASFTGVHMPDSARALEHLHAPMLYLSGGPSDIAYFGAQHDFRAIDGLPVAWLNENVGHYPGTYRHPHGGDFAVAAVAWLDWRLKDMAEGRQMFLGPHCGLCKNPKWKIELKNMGR